MDTKGTPMVSLGTKGMIYVEFVLKSLRDHSKRRGHTSERALEDGEAPQPAQGRRRNDGAGDAVTNLAEDELEVLKSNQFDGAEFKQTYGQSSSSGTSGTSRRRKPWSSCSRGTSRASMRDTKGPVRRQSSQRRYTSSGWSRRAGPMEETQKVP